MGKISGSSVKIRNCRILSKNNLRMPYGYRQVPSVSGRHYDDRLRKAPDVLFMKASEVLFISDLPRTHEVVFISDLPRTHEVNLL